MKIQFHIIVIESRNCKSQSNSNTFQAKATVRLLTYRGGQPRVERARHSWGCLLKYPPCGILTLSAFKGFGYSAWWETYFQRHCRYFMASEWVLKGVEWYLGGRPCVLEGVLDQRASKAVSHLFQRANLLCFGLLSLWAAPLFLYHRRPIQFHSLMPPRRETAASRAQGKRPAEPSQPSEAEARRKARFEDRKSTRLNSSH